MFLLFHVLLLASFTLLVILFVTLLCTRIPGARRDLSGWFGGPARSLDQTSSYFTASQLARRRGFFSRTWKKNTNHKIKTVLAASERNRVKLFVKYFKISWNHDITLDIWSFISQLKSSRNIESLGPKIQQIYSRLMLFKFSSKMQWCLEITNLNSAPFFSMSLLILICYKEWTSFTSTNVKLRQRFDFQLTFTWRSRWT